LCSAYALPLFLYVLSTALGLTCRVSSDHPLLENGPLVAEYLRHDRQRTAAAVYNGTFILIAICYNLLWRRAAVSDRLLHAPASRHAVQRIFDYRYGPLWYLTAFMLTFVSVPASLVVIWCSPSSSSDRPPTQSRQASQ
jgi:hypothetical protein